MFSPSLHAQNKVLGEIELVGASKVENTSSAPGIGDQTVIENSISCAEAGNFLKLSGRRGSEHGSAIFRSAKKGSSFFPTFPQTMRFCVHLLSLSPQAILLHPWVF
jgi:hypothetical protein